ncbi:MAG: PD-(D/E)XK motif protein [Pseudomonadota bacterium]
MDRVYENIVTILEDLEGSLNSESEGQQRIYRRMDLERETGIRLSCASPGAVWELLIEAGGADDKIEISFPRWKGMNFDVLTLDVPTKRIKHIRLFLDKKESRDIFVTVCADLVRGLEVCLSNESRRKEIADFLFRWSRFFERYGEVGLSSERQRGLYGELWWLRRMIEAGIEPAACIGSWKGCGRAYHDFQIEGHIVEVKTTMTKEPREVVINNERQLDDRGLSSLHLLVVTLLKVDGQGETLTEIVNSLRESFVSRSSLIYFFESSLRESGYLDIHSHLYNDSYVVNKEELFRVGDGFPRIIEIPQGLGNIRYSLVIAACRPFLFEPSEYLKTIKGVI